MTIDLAHPVNNHCTRAENDLLLGKELDGDGRLGEALLREEWRVGEHHVERLAQLARNVDRRFVVEKSEL